MANHTHTTFPTKKAALEHQKRVSAMAAEGTEEEKHILANRYKTKMCKNFVAKGECPYEVRCMFAHGEHELRTSEDNVRDGLVTEEAIRAFQRQQNPTRRRPNYAVAREAEARVAASAAQQEVYVETPDNSEEDCFYHSHDAVNTPRFIPHAQSLQYAGGFYAHNPYAFSIIPAEAREFAVFEEVPEEGYWYEEPMAAVEEDYYFPSSDMPTPLVPNSIAQPQQYNAAAQMYSSADCGGFREKAAYGERAQCVAAEMPSFSEEAPMVLEP